MGRGKVEHGPFRDFEKKVSPAKLDKWLDEWGQHEVSVLPSVYSGT